MKYIMISLVLFSLTLQAMEHQANNSNNQQTLVEKYGSMKIGGGNPVPPRLLFTLRVLERAQLAAEEDTVLAEYRATYGRKKNKPSTQISPINPGNLYTFISSIRSRDLKETDTGIIIGDSVEIAFSISHLHKQKNLKCDVACFVYEDGRITSETAAISDTQYALMTLSIIKNETQS